MALLSGEFGGMTIRGTRWATPLQLTAERIEVDVGELLIDYGALVMQQKVLLRNIPSGTCSLVLTAQDLGNFMTHELMKGVAANAIQGETFNFDKDTVRISVDSQGRGFVDLEGVWVKDKQRYKIRMVPTAHNPAGTSMRLHVSAKRMLSAAAAGDGSSSVGHHAAAAHKEGQPSGASAVANGMAKLFSSLTLNLQGVELKSPMLEVLLPGASGRAVMGGSSAVSEPMLQIGMKLKIRSVPPLDMRF